MRASYSVLILISCIIVCTHAFFSAVQQASKYSISIRNNHRNILSSPLGRNKLQLIGSNNEIGGDISKLTASSLVDQDVEAISGPLLSRNKREVIKKFITTMGGKRVIQRILIANNGMAATKAIISMRQWAYMTFGDERAIEFIAMATRDDLNANAEFIRLADAFVEVPSGSNKV